MPNKDPFRTLDDPEPPKLPDLTDFASMSVRADRITSGIIIADSVTGIRSAGYWVLPDKRPNWWRRFWAWALLGWKWKQQ
jgi:hypothetical protein